MNTTTRSTASLLFVALAGGVFGLAMAFRESAESVWVRAAVAGVGAAVGVGVAMAIRQYRKKPGA